MRSAYCRPAFMNETWPWNSSPSMWKADFGRPSSTKSWPRKQALERQVVHREHAGHLRCGARVRAPRMVQVRRRRGRHASRARARPAAASPGPGRRCRAPRPPGRAARSGGGCRHVAAVRRRHTGRRRGRTAPAHRSRTTPRSVPPGRLSTCARVPHGATHSASGRKPVDAIADRAESRQQHAHVGAGAASAPGSAPVTSARPPVLSSG